MTQEEINKYAWLHTIDFGNGLIAKGPANTKYILSKINLPEDLTGKTVIDLGACDGFYSFECEKRGAARVLAVDSPHWGTGQYGISRKKQFNLARKLFNSKVEDLEIDLHNLKVDLVGQFDIVLFLGILYHLDNPVQCLKNACEMTKELCIIETHVDLLNMEDSAARFYPANPPARHWWGPNTKCVTAWAEAGGFSEVKLLGVHDRYGDKCGRAVFHLKGK